MNKWWMKSVGYQVYLKSFFDSNDDGIGDLMGLYEKLDYLYELGINLLWIGPIFDSPMDDEGYDVKDHFNIYPKYGTLDDFKKVIKRCKELGIRVILDFVLNHTSDEHPWFIESRKSKLNAYHDYYIWQKPKIIDGIKTYPTNWASFFGGSAWAYDEHLDMYYMKIFSNKMPDLNWKNPKVMDAFIEIGQFYLSLGIDGFRIDALSHLARENFEDSNLAVATNIVLDTSKFSNLPDNLVYTKILKEKLFKDDILTIGEMGGGASAKLCLDYTSFDANLLSMVFNFDHNWCNNIHEITSLEQLQTNTKALKEVLSKWQYTYLNKGYLPLNWLNHDQPRLASHYGSSKYPFLANSMLATLMYFQRGMPFIYQGEEIGMTNYAHQTKDEFRDVSSLNYYAYLENEKILSTSDILFKVSKTSRDQARTIFQWDDSVYAGFSTFKPWNMVNPNKKTINVKQQLNDDHSLLNYYKKVIYLRTKSIYSDTFVYGSYQMLNTSDDFYVYVREHEQHKILVIISFRDVYLTYNMIQYHVCQTILTNDDDNKIKQNIIHLVPFGAMVLKVEDKK